MSREFRWTFDEGPVFVDCTAKPPGESMTCVAKRDTSQLSEKVLVAYDRNGSLTKLEVNGQECTVTRLPSRPETVEVDEDCRAEALRVKPPVDPEPNGAP